MEPQSIIEALDLDKDFYTKFLDSDKGKAAIVSDSVVSQTTIVELDAAMKNILQALRNLKEAQAKKTAKHTEEARRSHERSFDSRSRGHYSSGSSQQNHQPSTTQSHDHFYADVSRGRR
jgi:hypothetical protein